MSLSSYLPSQVRYTSVSIDSRFAEQYNHRTSDFVIRLPSTSRDVARIALSSVELPQVAYVFSKKAGNTTLFVDVCGTPVRADISEGNYSPTELAAAVEAAIRGAGVSGATVTYTSITDRFVFGGAVYTLSLYDNGLPFIYERARYWGLGFNMGFRKAVPVVVSAPVVTPAPPTIAAPPYVLLQVLCPDLMENTVHMTGVGTYVNALAKLVLRSGAYHIQYDDGGNLLRKENVFAKPVSISLFRIRLLDAFGDLVDMADADWSLTFELTEILTSSKYVDLKRANKTG